MTNTSLTRRSTTTRMRTGLKAAALAGAVAAGAIGITGVAATPASASAYGCTATTRINVPKTPFSVANWCGGPVGSGLTIESVNASFASSRLFVGYQCNTSMKVEVFDGRGESIWVGYTPTQDGCFQAGGAFDMAVNTTFASEGHVETSLLSYGANIATLSHNLHS